MKIRIHFSKIELDMRIPEPAMADDSDEERANVCLYDFTAFCA